jgi:hypothetical protein
MKKLVSSMFVILMLVGFTFLPAISAEAKNVDQSFNLTFGDQDFLLVNSTGVEINALYVTPHNAKKWGEDILGADTLGDGEDLLITFPNKTKSQYWDLRVEDEDGAFIEWDNLNLMKISRVELFFKNGKATADLQ